MKTRVDAEAFVRCARKVEALGAATQGAPPTADVLARAALLTAHLHDNFLTLCSGTEEGGGLAQGPTTAFADADAFCGALRGVRFVPSHAASALAGPHEGEPVLACFGELALHQDRRLLWTVAPVLRREWAPPRELWPALGLLHPPPMESVLAHAAQLAAWAPDAWPFDGAAEPLRARCARSAMGGGYFQRGAPALINQVRMRLIVSRKQMCTIPSLVGRVARATGRRC